MTEWKEYSDINWESVSKLMRSPSWVFDLRSVVNPQQVLNTNLKLWRVGDGSIKNIEKLNLYKYFINSLNFMDYLLKI